MIAQKTEMYANMWSKVDFTWQLLAKVQKTTEADIGTLLASVNPSGIDGGGNTRMMTDVTMKAVRDTPVSASPSGSHFSGLPMDISPEPNTSVSTASAIAATHGGGPRGHSGGDVAGRNANAGAR